MIPSRVLPPPPPTPLTSLPGSRSSRPQLVSTLKIPSDREDRAYLSGDSQHVCIISCACMRYSLILRYKVRAQYPNHCRHGCERPAPPPGPSVASVTNVRALLRPGVAAGKGGKRRFLVAVDLSGWIARATHGQGGRLLEYRTLNRVRPGRARGDGGDGRLVRGREGGESGGGAFFLPKKVNVNKYRIR